MCGIAGVFRYRETGPPPDRDAVLRMTRALEHRGPDDEGFFFHEDVAFGHRRLSIVDLSPTGHQPMTTEDGRFTITYNGEFYNHALFRRKLADRSIRFRGTSDTESLLYAVGEYGPEILEQTAGIFAFGLFDRRERSLLLARDPLGVKQLYFHDDGQRVVFASEIKALLLYPGVPRQLNTEALNDYLHFHTPLFERTFFKDIDQVAAGSFLRFGASGRSGARYWSIDDFSPIEEGSLSRKVQELLSDVVREQLMSDVPVGSFFSGGIDSSAVAEFARRSGKKPLCFGVHFTDQGVIDERPYQEAAASALGLDLQLITVDGRNFPAEFERLMYFQDQPLIGPALIPMYHVSKLASSKVKVCLGGQGADEIFGGYARYALTQPLTVIRTAFQRSNSGEGARVGGNLRKQLSGRRNIGRLFRAAKSLTNWRRRYVDHFANVPEHTWQTLLADPTWASRRRAQEVFDAVTTASGAPDAATRAMHWDVQTYLTGLFQQDDRMSMANSLESRVPISDPRLVRLAFRIPLTQKFRSGASKWILREAVRNVLPEFVLNRRKVGFDTPVERWLRDQHFDWFQSILTSRKATERGFWKPEALTALAQKEAMGTPGWFDVAWKALSIELWARTMLDTSPEQHLAARDVPAARPAPV
jgi:asparagine synthase (glutamine-hydrolysing)